MQWPSNHQPRKTKSYPHPTKKRISRKFKSYWFQSFPFFNPPLVGWLSSSVFHTPNWQYMTFLPRPERKQSWEYPSQFLLSSESVPLVKTATGKGVKRHKETIERCSELQLTEMNLSTVITRWKNITLKRNKEALVKGVLRGGGELEILKSLVEPNHSSKHPGNHSFLFHNCFLSPVYSNIAGKKSNSKRGPNVLFFK